MSRMRVSVLIPAHNAAQTLGLCLDALARQSRAPEEVVVVDNASTDGTGEVARGFSGKVPGLRVVSEPRLGEAAARNRSLAEANGEVLAFTDADCVPDDDWLANALRCLEEGPDCAAVAGPVVGYRPRGFVERYLSVAAFPTPRARVVVHRWSFPPPTFYTANLLVRREALQGAGPFDETLPVGVDVDLCLRLLRGGHRILYDPRPVVAHVQRDSLRKMTRRLFQYGTGVPGWFRKHAEAGLWLTLPGHRAVRVPLRSWRGWVNLSTPDRIALAFVLAAAWQPWAALPLVAYLARLGWTLRDAARERGVPVLAWELPALVALHLVDFAVFTAGSIRGSVRHRVLCVV